LPKTKLDRMKSRVFSEEDEFEIEEGDLDEEYEW
jgi:hypothetical protein